MLTFETKRNEILKALDGTEYCRTQEDARLYALRDKVRDFARIRGNGLSEGEVADIARTLDGALMRYYDSLPLREVELALEWEMVTGDAIRLTVHNMLRGVAKYVASDERKSAFAVAKRDRDRGDGPLSPQEVNLLNHEAMLEELRSAWDAYRGTGRLEPYRTARGDARGDGLRGGFGDALRGTRRHVYAGCYAWLRTFGVVPDGDENRRREAVCLGNARREGAESVPSYAEALMLEWVFSEARREGRDLGAEIDRAAGLTTDIVCMNTPLAHLETN